MELGEAEQSPIAEAVPPPEEEQKTEGNDGDVQIVVNDNEEIVISAKSEDPEVEIPDVSDIPKGKLGLQHLSAAIIGDLDEPEIDEIPKTKSLFGSLHDAIKQAGDTIEAKAQEVNDENEKDTEEENKNTDEHNTNNGEQADANKNSDELNTQNNELKINSDNEHNEQADQGAGMKSIFTEVKEIINETGEIIEQLTHRSTSNPATSNNTAPQSQMSSSRDEDGTLFSSVISSMKSVGEILEKAANDKEPEDTFITDSDAKSHEEIQVDNNNEEETKKPEEEEEEKPKKKKKREEDEAPQYSDQELEDAYDCWVKSKQLPTFLMRDAVVDYARLKSLKATIAEDYDEAARLSAVAESMATAAKNDQGQFDAETRVRVLERRLAAAKERRARRLAATNESIKKAVAERDADLDGLRERQSRAVEDFAADASSPEFISKYTKASSELLEMRAMQRSLALSHDFDGAKAVKASADRLERRETELARDRAEESIARTYKELARRQERELRCAEEHHGRVIGVLQKALRWYADTHDAEVRQLEHRLEDAKRQKKSALPPLRTSEPGTPARTNRSTKAASKFRRAPCRQTLDVRITDVRGILARAQPRARAKSQLGRN